MECEQLKADTVIIAGTVRATSPVRKLRLLEWEKWGDVVTLHSAVKMEPFRGRCGGRTGRLVEPPTEESFDEGQVSD